MVQDVKHGNADRRYTVGALLRPVEGPLSRQSDRVLARWKASEGMTQHGKATTRLGRMMKCYRMVDDLSLRDLAKQIGTSAATVMRIEQGYEVDQRTFLRIVNWMVTR